jgi:hypothetical protein
MQLPASLPHKALNKALSNASEQYAKKTMAHHDDLKNSI